jgi:Protein of unknown function (DUF3000)
MRQVGGVKAPGDEAAAAFTAVVAGLRSGQEQVCAVRPELTFEDVPAPRTLAPFAAAFAATARIDGTEVASGRFVLLYDPAGQRGWAGPLRVIVYIRADLEPEIAADPMLGEVAWSWLTEALDARTSGYAAPSGTVTRVVTEGFGAKREEPQATGFELRASWSPVGMAGLTGPPGDPPGPAGPAGPDQAGPGQGEPDQAGLDGHLAAWCGAMCAAAGLPPLVAGVTALRPPPRRRGP